MDFRADRDILPERLSSTDMVLVGKLTAVEERAVIEKEMAFGYQGQPVESIRAANHGSG
jgi:hypothetical protein